MCVRSCVTWSGKSFLIGLLTRLNYRNYKIVTKLSESQVSVSTDMMLQLERF